MERVADGPFLKDVHCRRKDQCHISALARPHEFIEGCTSC